MNYLCALTFDLMMLRFTQKDGAIIFTVRVAACAAKSEITGELDGALKVRIASPPVDGAANAELIRFLAKKIAVSKSEIEIVSGRTAKTKLIKISGSSAEKLLKAVGG